MVCAYVEYLCKCLNLYGGSGDGNLWIEIDRMQYEIIIFSLGGSMKR